MPLENSIEKQTVQLSQKQPTTMDLISLAQSQNASVEQLRELWELHRDYEKNEAAKAFHEAMSGFRSECPIIKKTRKAYSSKYAGLAESLDLIQPLLSRYGLSHRWNETQQGDSITVICTITHRMGHSESTSLTAGPDKSGSKNSIQAIGSTITYLQRYTLFSILGMASTDQDDDGNGASVDPDDYLSENQIAEMTALIDEVRGDMPIDKYTQSFCSWAGYPTMEAIPRVKYKQLMNALERKRGPK